MIQTRIYITCDDCGNPFPACGNCPAPIDGAIFTPGMLRADAKEAGWKRSQKLFMAGIHDLCPRCARKHAKKGGRG